MRGIGGHRLKYNYFDYRIQSLAQYLNTIWATCLFHASGENLYFGISVSFKKTSFNLMNLTLDQRLELIGVENLVNYSAENANTQSLCGHIRIFICFNKYYCLVMCFIPDVLRELVVYVQ